MKILSSSQIRAADQFTIENEPILSIDLMERASRAFVSKFTQLFTEKKRIIIFCGTGNNGGDGLAIGRMLIVEGWEVSIFTLGESGSPDFEKNLKRTKNYALINEPSDFPKIEEDQVVIDGLFGSGLTRPVEGIASALIHYLNQQNAIKISIDIASGVYADVPIEKDSIAFRPHHTISFQVPKLVFFLPQYHEFVGEWHVVDIGLDQEFIAEQKSEFFFSERKRLETLIPKRDRFSHKSQVGKLLIIAGSHGKMGAAVLCAKAALRTGVGLINVHVPKCGVEILQISVPEAMIISDNDQEYISEINASDSTIAIGPGIGTQEKTKEALELFLTQAKEPMVLDADALNILAANKSLLSQVPEASILTPHPGEFKRLVGDWNDDFEKLELLKSFCIKHKLNTVLKGAYSAVCDTEGNIYFNPSGNPGMATAGSGDVLTGIVSSLLAQGLNPFHALQLGVYIHGLAGDLAAVKVGQISLVASDIISCISNSFETKSV